MSHYYCPNCKTVPCECNKTEFVITESTKTQGTKFDSEKLRFDLIPVLPMIEVAKVFTMGAQKYGDRNWENGLMWMRCIGAIFRHLFAWILGETNDSESGINHLAHAVVNLLFLLEYHHTHLEMDNRPKKQNLNVRTCFEYLKEKK
jgi:hypothetical protein